MSYRDDLLALMAASWADLQGEIARVRDQFAVEAKNGVAMIELWRPRSAADILAELHAAHAALVQAIEETDEAGCAPGKRRWNTIHADGAGHYTSHFPIPDRLAEARAAAEGRS